MAVRSTKKVLVLGASGMLGSMVAHYLSDQTDIELTLTTTTDKAAKILRKSFPHAPIELFDAKHPDDDLLRNSDWIVNCIGMIKQLMDDSDPASTEAAVTINSLFPHKINAALEGTNTRVIQIATDCVFSGEKGSYQESDPHDAHDVYGKTKSLGEVPDDTSVHLRCSIIGPEAKNRLSLLEWFLGQPKDGEVTGFTNHFWNGITTLHYAKLCLPIIRGDVQPLRMQHVIAGDTVSKYEMLKCFAKYFDRPDVVIHKGEGATVVDRSLATKYPKNNLMLWRAAGYDQPPGVEQMIKELAEVTYSLKLD